MPASVATAPPERRVSTGPRSISAVLPAYNEQGAIGTVVTGVHRVLSELPLDRFEIIVVDDGSRDNTADVVHSLGLPEVRVIRHGQNLGYGSALRTGFDAAVCEATWLSDSDGQFRPEDVRLLLAAFDANSIVIGQRMDRADHLIRKFNAWAFFTLVRLLFGRTVSDVDCGFKLFPRQAGVGLTASGAMISTELVLRGRRDGRHLAEVAVPHYPRLAGTPTGANWRVVARAFQELWHMRRHPSEI